MQPPIFVKSLLYRSAIHCVRSRLLLLPAVPLVLSVVTQTSEIQRLRFISTSSHVRPARRRRQRNARVYYKPAA